MFDKIPFHTLRNGGLAMFVLLIAAVAFTGLFLGRHGETQLKIIIDNNDRQARLLQIRGDLIHAHALYDRIVENRLGGLVDIRNLIERTGYMADAIGSRTENDALRETMHKVRQEIDAVRFLLEPTDDPTPLDEPTDSNAPFAEAAQRLQRLVEKQRFLGALVNDPHAGDAAPIFIANAERLIQALADLRTDRIARPESVVQLLSAAMRNIQSLCAEPCDDAMRVAMESLETQAWRLAVNVPRLMEYQEKNAQLAYLDEELLHFDERWRNLERNVDAVINATQSSMLDYGQVISHEWSADLSWTLAFFAVLILCSVGLSYALHRSIHERVDALVRGAQALARGDTAFRIPIDSKDQLAKVAVSFNRMAARLQRKETQLDQAFQDIHDAKQLLERRVAMRTMELEQANSELAMMGKVFEHSAEGIVLTDLNGAIINANPAFTRITGYPLMEALGKTPNILKSGRYTRDFYAAMWDSLQKEGVWKGEIWNRRKNGNIYPQMTPMSRLKNASGEAIGYVAVFSDVSDRKRKEEIIRRQALHDHLTGLPNRAFFMEQLETAARRAGDMGNNLALLFIDLDDFKDVNDDHGHKAGDVVLQTVARRMESVFRSSDILCRLGGDEFVVLMNEFRDVGVVHQVTTRALNLLLRPIVADDVEVAVGVSIGAAIFPEDARKPEALLEKADAAMYFAKKQGKGQVAFYHDLEKAP